MKNILLILILSFLSVNASSQIFVGEERVDINSLDIEYCQIVGYNKSLLGQKIIVTVDYGQKFKFFNRQRIEDKDGKALVFNSMIDALNFMLKNGWEYEHNYAVSIGVSNVYHYLLKKKQNI
jgi:hypothetical protein